MKQAFPKDIAVIILAAGNSTRLRDPKQLLKLDGETLLHRTVRIAIQSEAALIYVVLGYRKFQMRKAIKKLIDNDNQIKIINNKKWLQGMATSISAALVDLPVSISAVIIVVCDQPYLSVSLLRTITKTYKNNDAGIVASRYSNGVLGVPALFSKDYFSNLSSLQGDKGARNILRDNKDTIQVVNFPDGSIDVDTQETATELKLQL